MSTLQSAYCMVEMMAPVNSREQSAAKKGFALLMALPTSKDSGQQ